ncbi:hypothetical protein [Streptomyces sp. AcH 505]|uniref:hypothetical protein n=1 Tax=Streptomyces sp. AcH 505 TaxID=352211 RepID=UPI0012FED18D
MSDDDPNPAEAPLMDLTSHLEGIADDCLNTPHRIRHMGPRFISTSARNDQDAVMFDAACLFLDVNGSSDILNALGRQDGARFFRALALGAAAVTTANEGHVRGVQGDAVLAFFTGPHSALRAVDTAVQVNRYASNNLHPRFQAHLGRNQAATRRRLGFSVGFGIDIGSVFTVPVDAGGVRDRIWAGRCVNTAAKLSKVPRDQRPLAVTKEVLTSIEEESKDHPGRLPSDYWSHAVTVRTGGALRTVQFGGQPLGEEEKLPL